MDAENDNDQPNSSSASASSSSTSGSNNSSSSNLLGHLPMLPFMRSTDDDEQAVDNGEVSAAAVAAAVDGNDNEEPMPLQPLVAPSTSSQVNDVVMAASDQPATSAAYEQESTMAPNTATTATTAAASTAAAAAATTVSSSLLMSSSSSAGHEEPMPTQAPSAPPTPQPLALAKSSFPASTSGIASLQQQLLAAEGETQQEEHEQQLTAHINHSDIAETIDASAVIVQSFEVYANEPQQQNPHLYSQEAANSGEEEAQANVGAAGEGLEGNDNSQQQNLERQANDIELDDNDNNDFDVDLNLRHDDEALANAASNANNTTTAAATNQQELLTNPLETSSTDSAGPSTSGQQQQQQTPQQQPPATLPLLLQQEEQQQLQQQTEESKHLPSFDHHYHNPREFHLHAHPYQHPCVYPYGYRASSPTATQKQQQQSNGNSINNIMFGTNNMSSVRNHGSSTSGLGGGIVASSSSTQVVDRLKLLYPNVNENETPLPRCWSPHDKCLSIGLSQNNLRVHFKGVGKQSNDAASVRTAHPIPPACGIYYFEVKIISKGKNGYMGIGLTAQQFRMNRLPGWDKQSYGYHGDDGNSFSSSGHGQSYGPTFTTGDIIGCCVNFVDNTCFYTKNGIDLGIAFRDLPTKLYPTVGLQTPGEEVDANFGQEPFKFDQIEDMMKQMRGQIKTAIYNFPLPAEQGDPTTLLQKLVSSYLVHNGYSQTAEAFARQKTGQNQREDITSIRNRQKILKLVMSGKMGQAIEQTMRLYPGLLENNKNLWFMLKCRQFIEMINGSDVEYCPSSSTTTTTTNNKTTHSITTQTSAPNQTSVIQSTKSYQSVNGAKNSSNGNTTIDASTSTSGEISAPTTTNNCSSTATNTNNAQNSSHITVINTDNEIKTHSNLVEHCSTSNDATTTTISKSNNDNDYLNDVEMENNSHTTNGNICKNGNTSNFNESIDADEEMDVDVSPSIKKYSHGIERILEFGKDLSQMGQQLEKENKMTDEERQMLEDAFSLIAYSNPWASPLGWQLCPTKRETVCRALNSAILESMSYPKWPPLEYCVAHANELLKVMAQASLGACAFVNIADVFPKN